MHRIPKIILLLLLSVRLTVAQSVISTVAGGGPNNMPAIDANLRPGAFATNGSGNYWIVSENRVFKVDGSGQLTLVAGNRLEGFSGDGGPALEATFKAPAGLSVDAAGNIYVSDSGNARIRRVDALTGVVTTVVGSTPGFEGDGGPPLLAKLSQPSGIWMDSYGDLYIADFGNNRIRRVNAGMGIITTVAGSASGGFQGDGGPATAARLNEPTDVATGPDGSLYIADRVNSRIRRVDAHTAIINTVAGNGGSGYCGDGGLAVNACLSFPPGVALDSSGNLFIGDIGNRRVRRVDAATGNISTIAGNGNPEFSGDGGPALAAGLSPDRIAVMQNGNVLVADDNRRVRQIDSSGIITTAAGNLTTRFSPGFSGDGGPATDASVSPNYIALDSAGNLFLSDFNDIVRRVDRITGIITRIAGIGVPGFSDDGDYATNARFREPADLAVDSQNNVFFVDRQNVRVRRVDAMTGILTTVAGSGQFDSSGDGGPATSAGLSLPSGLALDDHNNLFIADRFNRRVRRVDATTGIITTVAGNGHFGFSGDGGPATEAAVDAFGVSVDHHGNILIADITNQRVRRVDAATNLISSVAGNGVSGFAGDGGPATGASLRNPNNALAGDGDFFIADTENRRVRYVDSEGTIITVAGNGASGAGGDGGPGTLAPLNFPRDVAVDKFGRLFISEFSNGKVRILQTAAQAIAELIDVVEVFNLSQGINNSLDVKLENARRSLESQKNGQRDDAISRINAFKNEVEAQRGNALTDSQANILLGRADTILQML